LEENDSKLLILDRIIKKNCEKWLLNINVQFSENRATLQNPKNTGNDGKVHFTDLNSPLSKKKYFRITSQRQSSFALVVLMFPFRDNGVATHMFDQKWNQKLLKKLLNHSNYFHFYYYSHQSYHQYCLLFSMMKSKYNRTTPSISLTEVSLFILENTLNFTSSRMVKHEQLLRGKVVEMCAFVIPKVGFETYKLTCGRVCLCSSHDDRIEMFSILTIFNNELKITVTSCRIFTTVSAIVDVYAIYGKKFPTEIYYLLLVMNEISILYKTHKFHKLKNVVSSQSNVPSISKSFKEKSITFSFIFSYDCQPLWNTATCEVQGTTTDVFSLARWWSRTWRRERRGQCWCLRSQSWSRVMPSGSRRKIYSNGCICLKKINPYEEGILGRIFKEDIRTLESFTCTIFDINYCRYHHYYCHDHFYLFAHFFLDVSYFIFCISCAILTILEPLTNIELRLEIDKVRLFTVCIKNSVINICIFDLTSRLVLDINLGLKFTSNPMRPWSRDTSFYWLCGQKTIVTTLKRLNSLLFLFDHLKQKANIKAYLFWNCYKYEIFKINIRHARSVFKSRLYNDIESNPGPTDNDTKLIILTLNCRGLGNVNKFRLILKKATLAINENQKTVIMLQETMIKNDSYLKLTWKGAYAITYGNGNSQGCITLARQGVEFINQKNLGSRGHCIEVKGLTAQSETITMINIYAPNGYSNEKRLFFEEVCNFIENSPNWSVILAGDFNLTFSEVDRHNRNACAEERNIATDVKENLDQLGMIDTWQGRKGMTWRRGATMSRLDRIYARLNSFRLINVRTNWTFSDSDHALVQATFVSLNKKLNGPRVKNLNPQVVLDPDKLMQLRQYLVEQLEQMGHNANPHLKLEFAKVTIRTKALELGKRILTEEMTTLKMLDEDIKLHERLLSEVTDATEESEIMLHLERQLNEKNRILNEQGKHLAWKAKTKWYNDGEKSNKYFLNLLKANAINNEMTSLRVDNGLVTEQNEINSIVNAYYRKLYNNDTMNIVDDEEFLNEMFSLDSEEANRVNAPIKLAELWTCLKPLKDTAPGPDGISHIYLKKLWDIIGPLILDAWHYSIDQEKLPPSHERSYLRLIPKIGKDTTLLKNWRPITLSNCDHKLITRVYNSRLINLLSKYISKTQTAYIRKRNITDNIRTISAAIQLANCEPDIDGSIIALDAQKAFDTVSHRYLAKVLNKVGLSAFVPIFKLLYSNLINDTVLSGQIIGQHSVKNVVKQGDALSCTLFILAIEPLIRNIETNARIKSIKSRILGYQWPKVLGYADDITCIIRNDSNGKQALFSEYERFSRESGLILNADKTEIYNFGSVRGRNGRANLTKVNYMGKSYEISSVGEIRVNGVILSQNKAIQKHRNCEVLIAKMDKHFMKWSKRQLTLLGKIQIYKTFGISQSLYHLSIIEPELVTWKGINDRLNRFLWNKQYILNQPRAPARIKKEILITPLTRGGFGMIDLREVVTSVRLRRHFVLLDEDIHPLSQLVSKLLDGTSYLGIKPDLEVDEITRLNMEALRIKRIHDCNSHSWDLETDRILHCNLLDTNIQEIVRPRKMLSNEIQALRRNMINSLRDVILNPDRNLNILTKIAQKELLPVIKIMARIYRNTPLPTEDFTNKIKDLHGRWTDATMITSKKLRDIFFNKSVANPKIVLLDEETKMSFYYRISKLVSTKNKSAMLRLLYGDVYCAEHRFRFGLSENDRCKRCFEKETIMHLLMDCSYTKNTYTLLGINSNNIEEVLGTDLNSAMLEIQCDVINYLVFRQHTMPPEILVRSTLEKYAKGLANKNSIKKAAEQKLRRLWPPTGQTTP
jgi:hypothetical protein